MDLTRLKAIKEQQAINNADNKRAIESKLSTLDLQETVVKSFSAFKDYLDGKTSKAIVVNQIKDFATHQDAEKFVSELNSLHDTLKTHENTDISPLTEVMKSVLDQVTKLPKELPETPEQKFVDYTQSIDKLTETVKAVESAVKAQKIKVEAPVVNVDAPQVTVDAPDLKPLSKEITDKFEKAIKGIVFPKITPTDLSKLEKEQKTHTRLLKEIRDKPVGGGGGGGGSSWVATNSSGIPVPIELDSAGNIPVVTGLVPKTFDTIQVTSYNANNDPLIVVYRTGGAAGTVVATLTITYDVSNNITQVVRT